MPTPIGQLLVQQGVLSSFQSEQIASLQRTTRRPFGELAEELYGIAADSVERAWADQYAELTRWVDPRTEAIDPGVLALISRRQAWQFGVLPMGYDGAELIVCTTPELLVRALNFTSSQIGGMCFLVLSEPQALGEALTTHYAMDGMTAQSLMSNGLIRRAG
jgi:hypothetical protein